MWRDDGERRVTIWNKVENRKVSGNAAPKLKNLQGYLAHNPQCEVYLDQDREAHPRMRRRKRSDSMVFVSSADFDTQGKVHVTLQTVDSTHQNGPLIQQLHLRNVQKLAQIRQHMQQQPQEQQQPVPQIPPQQTFVHPQQHSNEFNYPASLFGTLFSNVAPVHRPAEVQEFSQAPVPPIPALPLPRLQLPLSQLSPSSSYASNQSHSTGCSSEDVTSYDPLDFSLDLEETDSCYFSPMNIDLRHATSPASPLAKPSPRFSNDELTHFFENKPFNGQ
eukprot:c53225_g1_i1.p1 GENE.c53225_g1_i1~~c53225_g1_i1.p1  ORF type:complete len:276 (+),score=17.41 c53225_g1_i1:42-869(+)